MNQKSHLCRFLAAHPEQWESLLKGYGIRVKQEGPYAIFNYTIGCDFADPLVQEARGIILDTERLEVVCWPFRKFGNYNESYADAIDWSQARVLEKVDGSIIKLWYDPRKPGWQFSTNASLRAENAPVGEYARKSFHDLICTAENYADVPFDALDKEITYIFELVSPGSQVVVPYEATCLYHTGSRHNLSGEEMELDIGIRKPKAYPIHSLQECVETAVMLNRNASDAILAEGFVVVDGSWNRVKVKSPDYIARHHLTQMKSIPKRECVELLLCASPKREVICTANPDLIPVFKFYDYHLARLRFLADKLGSLTRQLYEEYSCDRGAVARVLKDHPLKWVGFHCLKSEQPGSAVLADAPLERICKLIPDYEPDDLSELFLDIPH